MMKKLVLNVSVAVLAVVGAWNVVEFGVNHVSAQTGETIDKADMEAALDDIEATIRSAESDYTRAQATLTNQSATLANIPTAYEDYLTAIDNLAGTTTWEELIQEKKTLFTDRYLEVKGDVDTVVAAFGE